MNNIINLAVVSPVIIYFAPLLGFLINQEPVNLYFFASSLLFGEVGNRLLKNTTKLLGPDFQPFQRPNPPLGGCSVFYDPVSSGSWGMPSGHAQIAFMAGVFWVLYIFDNYKLTTSRVFSIIVLLFMSLFISLSRVMIGCHTIPQVVIGGIIG